MDREDTPHDPDDFKRCRLLLLLIPEWRANLKKLADVFPWYAPFVNRWDEFDAMFTAAESVKHRTKKVQSAAWEALYNAMQLARVESVRIRYPDAHIVTGADGHLRSMRRQASE